MHREAEEARQQEERQRREAVQAERQRLEDEQATRLRCLTPEALARLESGEREANRRLAITRDDLEETLETWMESGLFEVDGTLTSRGRGLVKVEAPTTLEVGTTLEALLDRPFPGTLSRSPFER